MARPIYLDYNATTPVDPAVFDAMAPYFTEHFGNPSSGHAYGWIADEAVTVAREQLAGLIGARPDALTFTSGATEAANLAIRGAANAYRGKKDHVVTVATEHRAVLDPMQDLENEGYCVTVLGVQPDGRLDLEDLRAALTDTTLLVAVMWANNETGVIQPIPEIAEIVRERGALFMTDATQAVGKIPVDVQHADLLVCSAHKVYGPKGAGMLYVRSGTPFEPLMRGGSQERKRRGGTENVAAVVGLAEALERAQQSAEAEHTRLRALRDRLAAAIREPFGDAVRFNPPLGSDDVETAPHILNVSFPPMNGRAVDGEMLLLGLDLAGIHASSGSACTSGAVEPSHVLRALRVPRETANATVRLSLGRGTTEADVDFAAEHLVAVVGRQRGG